MTNKKVGTLFASPSLFPRGRMKHDLGIFFVQVRRLAQRRMQDLLVQRLPGSDLEITN
jgi:hypothetical protein